jgi:hypothetical protein
MAIQPATTDTTISSAANPVHSFDRCIAAHCYAVRSGGDAMHRSTRQSTSA